MTTIVTCPGCDKRVKIEARLLGARIKCPECGGKFAASAPGEVAALVPKTAPTDAVNDQSVTAQPRPTCTAPADEDNGDRASEQAAKRRTDSSEAADGRPRKSAGKRARRRDIDTEWPGKPAKKGPAGTVLLILGAGLAIVLALAACGGAAYWISSGIQDAGNAMLAGMEAAAAPEELPEEVRQFKGHTAEIRRVAVSPDGRQLLTAGWDKTFRLWDVESGRELLKWEGLHEGRKMHGVAFLPDGRRALTCCSEDPIVRLCDLKDGHTIRSYQGHTGGVWQVVLGDDGRTAASGGSESTVIVWDVETGKQLHRLDGNQGGVETVAFSENDKLLLAGSMLGPIRVWDVETGREVRRFVGHSGNVMGLTVSPDGQFAVSGGNGDKTCRVWRMRDGTESCRFTGWNTAVWSTALSADGNRALVGGEDGTLALWDPRTGQELYRFPAHRGAIWSVAFSPDAHYAFSAGEDKVVRMWRLPPVGLK